ncbi:MAG: ABC transporter ATP-binding protein [bacterium]|nr:ABC transporter ATP-binding protein [bacterium]
MFLTPKTGNMTKILEVKNLSVSRIEKTKLSPILNDINLFIKKGEVFCLVGESGSGKTTLALSIIKLIPKSFKISTGQIILDNFGDILKMSEKKLRSIRGEKISMIFQDPGAYLDPLFTIGVHLREALHRNTADYQTLINQTLREVGLEQNIQNAYPHQLSGGQQQRVMIAMALINNPALIIADEPTTALDVLTTQQIISLLNNIRLKYNTSMLFITHDIDLALKIGMRIAIMYSGYLMEIFKTCMDTPLHPYTKILTGTSQAKIGTITDRQKTDDICPFFAKCPEKELRCKQKIPFFWKDDETGIRCIKYGRTPTV